MRTRKRISSVLWIGMVGVFASLLPAALWAEKGESEHDMAMGHHAFAHPFFVHMGIPDGPGEISVRVSATQEALGEEVSRDLALHIETGIWNRIGLHFRNDAIKANTHSEMMIQYAVLENRRRDSGVCTFVEFEIPTNYVSDDEDAVVVELGVSGRNVFGQYAIMDAGLHYAPQESAVSIEASGVLRLTPAIFPILETQMEIKEDVTVASLLAGVKMRLRPGANIGVAAQFGLTDERHFDNQALVQLDIAY